MRYIYISLLIEFFKVFTWIREVYLEAPLEEKLCLLHRYLMAEYQEIHRVIIDAIELHEFD
jgi:hypothetical protein